MIIEIDALDTIFFRDGKPFTMGEDVWANGMFPPNPSVIYGALRSRYFSENISDLDKANGENDPTKDLIIKGIYLKLKGNVIHLPLPRDIVAKKELKKSELNKQKRKKEYTAHRLSFAREIRKDIIYSNNFQLLSADFNVENIETGIISNSRIKTYFNNPLLDKFTVKKISDNLLLEAKTGIGRDNSRNTTAEGKLYRVGFNRLKNMKILVDYVGLKIEEKGLLKFGGEGKSVSYKTVSENLHFDCPEIEDNFFKLYLLTPAIFKQGWKPEIDIEGVKLITASVGKFVNIGGFDIKEKKPKAMLKAVPAGSVYYFKFDGDFEEIKEKLHLKSISDFRQKEGFGITLIGRV